MPAERKANTTKLLFMKILKTLGILLLILIGIVTILMMVVPVKQVLVRTITINAKPAIVYDYLSRLSNFNKWSAWNKNDTSIVNTITGTDATLGAINNWKGDPAISGEGKIEITSLEINQEIEHQLTFISPKSSKAYSEFDLFDVNGQTQLRWTYDRSTTRPWNILNLFNSLDKEMGKNFEKSLANLKAIIEGGNPAATGKIYDVLPLNFPSTTYALRRKQLGWADIPSFYAENLPQIYEQAINVKATPGSPTGLFFVWDEQNQQTDMAAAVPVAQGTVISDTTIQLLNIPGSKAVYVNYYGAYDKTTEAYASIDKYLATNNLKQKPPVIEQYITDPKTEKDTAKWLTKIIFLVE
jgi:effector-binding domain-containing protein